MATALSFTVKICFVSLLFGVNCQTQHSNFATNPPFIAQRYAALVGPRGLVVDASNDILVLSAISSTSGQIIGLTQTPNKDGTISVEQTLIVNGVGLGLNHGIAIFGQFLYASSDTTVYRWPYVPGQRALVTTQPEIVIFNIPPGGHSTRTLVFDSQGRLYVSIGSHANVDRDSWRSRIRRFNLFGAPPGGLDFQHGEIFADGLRNEVGLDFDASGTLWGVECGADQLIRPDLGGDIHNGNPAEELNKFDGHSGSFYGYPYCFSSYNLTGHKPGTQFAWPTFMNDGVHTDAWCRSAVRNKVPVHSMPAHEAPLGIQFYKGQGCGGQAVGALPCSARGDAFVAFHGSWDSDVKVGYRVGWLPFDKSSVEPTGQITSVIYEPDPASCTTSTCFRPVSVVFDLDGHLIVSSDATNEIFRVYYNATPPRISNSGGRLVVNFGGILSSLLLGLGGIWLSFLRF